MEGEKMIEILILAVLSALGVYAIIAELFG